MGERHEQLGVQLRLGSLVLDREEQLASCATPGDFSDSRDTADRITGAKHSIGAERLGEKAWSTSTQRLRVSG